MIAGGGVDVRMAGVAETRKAVGVVEAGDVEAAPVRGAGTAVGVEVGMDGTCSGMADDPEAICVSGLAQNLALPQLQVTTKFSKKCMSDTGSRCVLCSTRGWSCGTSLRPGLSTIGALYCSEA